MNIKSERMNCRLLRYKYMVRHSSGISIISCMTCVILIFVSRALFHDSFFRSVYNVLGSLLILSACFFSYLSMVQDYRYRNNRKIFSKSNIHSPMGECVTMSLPIIVVAEFIPGAYRIILPFFIMGLIFFGWSKEIRRAKNQTRYVLGIILMLPLPVYAIYDILRALGLL